MIKTRDEMLAAIRLAGQIQEFMPLPWGESFLDHRDLNRLLRFMTYNEATDLYSLQSPKTDWPEPKPWDEPTLREVIQGDLDFTFEKAYNRRGISAELMHGVMRMWAWVLCDDVLAAEEHYDDYGIDFLKRFSEKHFPGRAIPNG
jgi:hypothetical protein